MALADILKHQRQFIMSLPEIGDDLPKSDRSFLQAITSSLYKPAVIAELKPKSPSMGVLAAENYNPASQATLYEQGGAAALSVLTEQHYFGGKLTDLTTARQATKLPVLCKDFILSSKQVKLARQAGADACLLIVAALDVTELIELKDAIESFNMLAVIEVHTKDELETALTIDPKVILINNRNLWDLSMHPETTNQLLPLIPKTIPVISASGFDKVETIQALPKQVTAVLMGTHLMQQGDPREFLKNFTSSLCGRGRKSAAFEGEGPKIKICGITRLEDALLAEQLGADYIGFIFHPDSPRYIEPAKAAEITARLSQAKSIGVFVHHTAEQIAGIADQVGLYGAQVYSFICPELPKHLVKIQALRIKNAEDLVRLNHDTSADFYLVDTHHEKHYGGTGETFDWKLLPQDRSKLFLAGGICHDNIKESIALKPYAIDVSSSVESSPGHKDRAKLERLFKEINL